MHEERSLLCPTIDHWKKYPVSVYLIVENMLLLTSFSSVRIVYYYGLCEQLKHCKCSLHVLDSTALFHFQLSASVLVLAIWRQGFMNRPSLSF